MNNIYQVHDNWSIADENMWDKNYYDNYTGTDTDDDGYGETPYKIQGTAGSKDINPLVERSFYTGDYIAAIKDVYTPPAPPLTPDTIAPNITVHTPENSTVFSSTLTYNITIDELNLDIVERENMGSVILKENDSLEVLRFVGGG